MLTRREADILAALIDTVVAPEPPLPPVAETDAVAAFDHWLDHGPRANGAALRVALLALEVAPRLRGRPRFRRLPRDERLALVGTAERTVRPLFEGLRAFGSCAYYGDSAVARMLGYDADERVAAGRVAGELAA